MVSGRLKKDKLGLKKVLVHGIVSGVGWAIGATIVFGVLIAILSSIFSWLGRVPVIGEFFSPVAEVVNHSENPKNKVFENNKPTSVNLDK